MAAAHSVTAPLTFVVPGGERLFYVPQPGGSAAAEVWPGTYEPRDVCIHNARQKPTPPSLAANGFQLLQRVPRVDDFWSDEAIQSTYTDDIRNLVLKLVPGAEEVIVFDHTRRSDSAASRTAHGLREPASKIHTDYTFRSGPKRAREVLHDHGGRTLAPAQHFCIVNVWRSIQGTVQRSPLAMCDWSTVQHKDLVPLERRAPGRIGEVNVVAHSPQQRWYYFPLLQPHEAIAFVTFDSNTAHLDGGVDMAMGDSNSPKTDPAADIAAFPLLSPHTAFADPTTPTHAPARKSIETRCLVLLKE